MYYSGYILSCNIYLFQRYQYHYKLYFFCGYSPHFVRPVQGMVDLVRLPVEQYKRDGRLVRGILARRQLLRHLHGHGRRRTHQQIRQDAPGESIYLPLKLGDDIIYNNQIKLESLPPKKKRKKKGNVYKMTKLNI